MVCGQWRDTEGETPQIEFDLEKTTSMNVHVPVLFHVGIQNVGNGSALNAKVWGEVKVLDATKDPDFKYDEAALTKKSISPRTRRRRWCCIRRMQAWWYR